MGHLVGTCVLEALYREFGDLPSGQCLALGRGVSRDPKFSEEPHGVMGALKELRAIDAVPTIAAWAIVFGIAVLAAIVGQKLARRS